jgi:hypothetical protein
MPTTASGSVTRAFRQANERIAAKAVGLHFVARVPFICECNDPACREFVLLRAEDYRVLRRRGRNVTLPGHDADGAVFAS